MAKEAGIERKECARRGFFGRMIVLLLSVLAVVGVVAMALSVSNAYINPQNFIWTTVFGLAFWVILIYNLVVFMLLLLMWSKKAWISVVALLIALPGIVKSYSFGTKREAVNSIRVMSYNAHNFNHIDGETSHEEFVQQVLEMLREHAPDILCCQEFSNNMKWEELKQYIEGFAADAGFQYVFYNKITAYGGNVIFSKYPVSKVDNDSGFGRENYYGVMASVDAGEKGRFHIANVHLLSYAITDNEIDILMSNTERQNILDTIGKTVLHKLSYAFQKRSEELQTVLKGIPPIEGPVLVCGDFNEPPLSYNYRQMQKAGFYDTFTKVGRGIKPTYAGRVPLLRIDYIWAKGGVKPLNFRRPRYKASDHYPIILDFVIQ